MTHVSSFLGLQTSLRGLLAQQRSLDVTGHNIANAGTAGYTRQVAELTPFRSLDLTSGAVAGGGGAHLGQGVEVESYRRVRDAFLDLQWRAQRMTSSDRDTAAEGLARIEETLGEPGDDGISALVQKFWNAWAEVANHPADGPTKQALVEASHTLAGAVQDLDRRLAGIAGAAADEYAALANSPQSPIFTAAQEIAQLNPAIKLALAAGRQPNDLLDRRDLLLDRLAEFGQVSVSDPDADGAIDVGFGVPAVTLVSGTTGAAAPPLPANTGSGRLGALLALQQKVAGYRAELDGFVAQLVTDVNAAHGAPFFDAADTTAATLGVVATAATVRTTASGGAGANEIARAIAALRNGAIDRSYDAFVRRVGADTAAAKQAKTTADALLMSVDDRRTSVAGVSLDEEMANMVRFQRGYQASARAMSTVDEMLDTLINRTGRVGL
jgi:flagellar hook-associated protein 1